MPRLLIEPRPYSLIRAQNSEPLFFFLASAASPQSLSLCNYSGDTTTRAPFFFHQCCDATVASRLWPRYSGQLLLWLDNVSLSATVPATLHHHASPSSSSTNVMLPPSRLASSHAAPATFTASLFPAPPFRARLFPRFPQLSHRGSSKVNFQRVFDWFSVLYMLIFNFSYCEC